VVLRIPERALSATLIPKAYTILSFRDATTYIQKSEGIEDDNSKYGIEAAATI
jgi:hypothetical protein